MLRLQPEELLAVRRLMIRPVNNVGVVEAASS